METTKTGRAMPKKASGRDAELIIRLYELRREPEMRKTREWWANDFCLNNADDFLKVTRSRRSRKQVTAPGSGTPGNRRMLRAAGSPRRKSTPRPRIWQ
jgi:hypothetical protein